MNNNTESTPPREHTLPDCNTIHVAVWWPGEGYGGPSKHETMDSARTHAQELLRMGYGKPNKNPVHIITKSVSTVEIVLDEIEPQRPHPKEPHGRTKGWSYFNPDTGVEWTRQHPVESGETPDAMQIEAMTLGEFRRRFPQEVSGT